jgi:integrase
LASLYRPKIVEYTLPDGSYRTPDGKRVTKNTPGAVRGVSRSKVWYGRYTDGNGKRQQVRLSESKEIARRMLAKLAGDAQLAGVGIGDPFAEHRARPLSEHLEDFGRYLAAKGNVPEHVKKTVAQCRAVLDGCGFTRQDDLQPSAVVEFLAGLRGERSVPALSQEWFGVNEVAVLCGITADSVRRLTRRGMLRGEGKGRKQRYRREDVAGLLERRARGIGIETSNHYLVSVKSFTKWMVKDRRSAFDPLAHLSGLNADLDKRHQRRALSAAEFGRFLEATAAGKPFRRIAGPDRIVLYCVAARTGLRASELGSLSPSSFGLGSDPATVTVQAGYSKHRREDVLPLRPDVAELVRGFVKDKPPASPLWPGSWTEAGAEMVRIDLEAAGIPYADAQGRVLDFHGLRHTFLTHLAESGVHPKVAQVLARHSTITLTLDRYTHLDVMDVAGDLDKLPDLPLKKSDPHGRKTA